MSERITIRSLCPSAALSYMALLILPGLVLLGAESAEAGGFSLRVGHGGYQAGYSSRSFSVRSYGNQTSHSNHHHGRTSTVHTYRPSHSLGHLSPRPYYGHPHNGYGRHDYRTSRYWRPRVRVYDGYYGNGYHHEESRRGRGVYGYTLKPDAYLKPKAPLAHPYALEAPKAAIPTWRTDSLSEAPPTSDADTAWEALAARRVDQARSLFAQQALAAPNDAMPKVGFALASALSGRLAQGAWSMRRAFEAGPQGLEVALSDETLIEQVTALREKYRRAGNALEARDGLFMVAALSYFSADSREAMEGATRLTDNGDSSESARSLVLLAQSLAGEQKPG